MVFSKKTIEKLKQLDILDKATNMSRQEFIAEYIDSDNITLKTMAQKYNQYNEDGTIGDVKRNLVIDIYDDDNNLTTNKRKYNKQVYNTFIIIKNIIDKYGKYNSNFNLPIEYIARCANTSNRTVKKAINTLLKYDIINFVGYSKENTTFAMCVFSLHNISKLVEWINHGETMHEITYSQESIEYILTENTKIKSEFKYEQARKKQVVKSLKAMKECPALIKIFNESNIYPDEDFKQKFLLDGKLRAYSKFTLTKNPEHHPSDTSRNELLTKLQNTYNLTLDSKYDLPASIYTLSYYLKTDKLLLNKNDQYFYSIFAKKLKLCYNNTSNVCNKDKEMIKTFCMTTYMHGYSFINKAQYLSGICFKDKMTNKEYELYISRNINKQTNEIIEYFSNSKINKNNLYATYKQFFEYAYNVMIELCDILKSRIFLYESLLFSIAINKSRELGYDIVNVYDCFYLPNEYMTQFKEQVLVDAYVETKNIYTTYQEKPNRAKNKELLEYLDSIDRIVIIDNRKCVDIGEYYIDFYNYTLYPKASM